MSSSRSALRPLMLALVVSMALVWANQHCLKYLLSLDLALAQDQS